jgi:hypothetical protein
MSSSPKPSSARRLVYSGVGGKAELMEAINFLFQIKGHEYQKKHSTFITPSAEEFLGYAFKVNEEFRKLKKHSPHRKAFGFAVTKPSRPVSSTKSIGTNDVFYMYITPWIHGEDPSAHLLQCLTIVFTALSTYNFVKESLHSYAESDKHNHHVGEIFQSAANICKSSGHAIAFSEPFHWFIQSQMSALLEQQEFLYSVLHSFTCEKIMPVLPKQLSHYHFPKEHISLNLGLAVISIISTIMMVPQAIDYSITLPIFVTLTRNGYEDCKTMCGEALLRCKQGPSEEIL